MHNFIDKKGNSFDAYWAIHGHPAGEEANIARTDPVEIRRYFDMFHSSNSPLIYTEARDQFIKMEVPGITGGIAYTFARTGIYGYRGVRPGTNYGAITVIMDDMDEKNSKNFEQDLKIWFTEIILNKFTDDYPEEKGWRRWNTDAERLFRGDYDEQLKTSLEAVIKPYLEISKQQSRNTDKIGDYTDATQKLRDEIAKLEQEKKNIEQQLAQKYAELEKL